MLVPEVTYDLSEPGLYPHMLPVGVHAELGFFDGRRSEVLVVEVTEVLQGELHRTQLVKHPRQFTELRVGQLIHFRPDHVLYWRPAPQGLWA